MFRDKYEDHEELLLNHQGIVAELFWDDFVPESENPLKNPRRVYGIYVNLKATEDKKDIVDELAESISKIRY